MIKVNVNASRNYDICIADGILNSCAELVSSVKKDACKTAVISDDRVFPLYGDKVVPGLKDKGFEVFTYVFENGEKSKTLETYCRIQGFLAETKLTRTDIIIALGGGVVGDVAGFCAATFLRGIEYVQIPTSLLAAVDSSVGGKTAVDMPEGKNLVGAFHQPSLVVCDTKCFDTLDRRQLASGFAEVIKYGVLCDKELFENLKKGKPDMPKLVERCVSIKRDVVASDEFDTGNRMFLNLGHTLGHAVEKYSDFKLTHGAAVAVGMMMIVKISEKYGYAKTKISDELRTVLEMYSLPAEYDIPKEKLYELVCGDKKTAGKSITLVIPIEIGKCELVKMPLEKLKSIIDETF